MLGGARSPLGELYVKFAAPPAGTPFVGGIAIDPNGAIYASNTDPEVYPNGLGTLNAGNLCTAVGGTIAGYKQGLPYTAAGRLVIQLNGVTGPDDTFVGGIRVKAGPLGGVYVTDAAPVVNSGFSSGFDTGFGG